MFFIEKAIQLWFPLALTDSSECGCDPSESGQRSVFPGLLWPGADQGEEDMRAGELEWVSFQDVPVKYDFKMTLFYLQYDQALFLFLSLNIDK